MTPNTKITIRRREAGYRPLGTDCDRCGVVMWAVDWRHAVAAGRRHAMYHVVWDRHGDDPSFRATEAARRVHFHVFASVRREQELPLPREVPARDPR